jgi:hypothetical protein
LGLNFADHFWERCEWRLPDDKNEETGKPKKMWLPSGIVIPTYHEGEVCRLRVRRFADDPRYVCLSGSGSQPMVWGRNSVCMVVESELDGILLSQVAGDLVSVLALGSAQARPDLDTHRALKDARQILLALDYDDAGTAQVPWWNKTYGQRVKQWPVPVDKDPGEAFQAGLDLREWVKAGIN